MGHLKTCLAILFALCTAGGMASAQNTAGVPPPGFGPDRISHQYRLAVVPEDGAQESRVAHRYHYEVSIDDRKLWRVIVQARDAGPGNTEYDYIKGELFWETTRDRSSAWRHGIRLDWQLNDGPRPDVLGIVNQQRFQFGEDTHLRLVGVAQVQTGDNAGDGVFLQSRARLQHSVTPRTSFGADMYSVYGSTDALGSFDNHRHQIGPFMSHRIGQGWSFDVGVLAGISDAAPDTDFRFWFTHVGKQSDRRRRRNGL